MKYEKWSFGYWLLKQYVRLATWFIHRKTIVSGRDKIPEDKPVVFAPNHQNALSDPLAVLLNTRFQPVWLARADIFGKSIIVDSILKFLKIIPVYRIRDGKENLDKNQSTFTTSIKVLKNKFALALFPEAAHTFKRQMMPHKKAVPRIVFMAEEKTSSNLDIQIIPTGIYYSDYWKFNRILIVNFGEPIAVNDYLEAYKQNPNAATVALKTRIYNGILPLTLNIKSKKYYEEFERIREIYGKHFLKRQSNNKSAYSLFKSDQMLAGMLDELELKKPDETEQIVNETNKLYTKIKKLGLRPWLLDDQGNHFLKISGNLLLLIAGLPLFIFGFVFNALPFFLVDWYVRKKIKDKSFWSTFFLVSGIVIFPLFYFILLFSLGGLIPSIGLKVVFLISLPLTGKFAFLWYLLLRKTTGRIRLLMMKWNKREKYWQLFHEKNQLFKKLNSLLAIK